jgi:hemerythrin superfamily protein
MDVTKILEADHEKVAKLFDEIEKADGGERQPLIDDLVTSLRGHMELEETVVYPAMEPVTGKEAVDEGNTEHELARDGIAQMIDLAPDEPGFGAALAAVKAGISHHVEEEENEIFPKLREKGSSVLHDMATPFMEKRMELGMPIQADALDASASKGELLAEAKSAEIDGAPSMSKAELADALAARMA